jgi:polyisoprenoid-binding protein YceI
MEFRMILARKMKAILFAVLGVALSAVAANSQDAYKIDPQNSKIDIQVAREGFLKAFGHDHLVSAKQFSGEVQIPSSGYGQSSVSFVVDAKSLVVVDPGESEKDRAEVQSTMLGEQVLDVARYPEIQFSSSAVKVVSNKKNTLELQVEGFLTLHGTKRTVTVPVRVQILEDGTLTADAEVSLLQSDFGITPIKIAGGTVRVKDKLKLTFHILAKKASS